MIRSEDGHSMVDALRASGADVRFILCLDAGHPESWERAYANQGDSHVANVTYSCWSSKVTLAA